MATIEDRLMNNGFKQFEIDKAIAVLNEKMESGTFNNSSEEGKYRYCRTIIENSREAPAKKKENFNLYQSENLTKILTDKFGQDWMNSKFHEIKTLHPSLQEEIKRHARVSYTYFKYMSKAKCDLDIDERIEFDLMAVEKWAAKGRPIEMNEFRESIAAKVDKQMGEHERLAMAKAMTCVYVCNYMKKVENDFSDEI